MQRNGRTIEFNVKRQWIRTLWNPRTTTHSNRVFTKKIIKIWPSRPQCPVRRSRWGPQSPSMDSEEVQDQRSKINRPRSKIKFPSFHSPYPPQSPTAAGSRGRSGSSRCNWIFHTFSPESSLFYRIFKLFSKGNDLISLWSMKIRILVWKISKRSRITNPNDGSEISREALIHPATAFGRPLASPAERLSRNSWEISNWIFIQIGRDAFHTTNMHILFVTCLIMRRYSIFT